MEGASVWRQGQGARDERDHQIDSSGQRSTFACPLCKCDGYEVSLAYRGAALLLYKCKGCTLTFANPDRFIKPRPDENGATP